MVQKVTGSNPSLASPMAKKSLPVNPAVNVGNMFKSELDKGSFKARFHVTVRTPFN